jgi:hypothetical protein
MGRLHFYCPYLRSTVQKRVTPLSYASKENLIYSSAPAWSERCEMLRQAKLFGYCLILRS